MSKLTQELHNRSIERGQWSDLSKHRSDLRLKGSGEGYVEELYFGKGFTKPPSFSYSAIFNNEDQQEVLSWALTPPRGSISNVVDSYGMGNDSLSSYGTIQDPSFEWQAKYHVLDSTTYDAAQVIPTVNQYMSSLIGISENLGVYYPGVYLPLADALRNTLYTNEWADKYAHSVNQILLYGPHRWFQTDDYRDLWSVDLTQHHDLGVGEAGQASATAVIGSGGYTNWLIPIDGGYVIYDIQDDPATQWRVIRSVSEEANSTFDNRIYAKAYPPPYIGGYEGFLYVKSDSPVTIETSATLSVENAEPEEIGGTNVFQNRHYWNSGGAGEPWLSEYRYREIAEIKHESTHGGGDSWSRVDIELPYSGWRAWPTTYTKLSNTFVPWDTYWTFRFRVKGTPGTVVHLDNIFLSLQMRNQEIPILTVGVDEWIRDESGVYIGAKLWVAMGSPTREEA